jgi:hypothetical protein
LPIRLPPFSFRISASSISLFCPKILEANGHKVIELGGYWNLQAILLINNSHILNLTLKCSQSSLQVFYSVLIQYFSALAGETPLPLSRIDVLVKPLLQMSQDTPLIAAVNARERILKMQQQLTAKLRDQGGLRAELCLY